ncbi:MAG TPA: M20/M25/M40 family metallo-hydrolase [Candidatus Saccharimonadales bacterium]|nr:M20/M25/M40 family metallo-hydrolase [Candidatus Saccharimonadales bacterium]
MPAKTPTVQAKDAAVSARSSKTNQLAEGILRDLVAIPSVTSDRTMNNKALDYVDNFLRERGMHIERFEWDGYRSLVATTRQTKTPTVFFMGHLDVVPASEDDFILTERDGRYYGRGALDMKSGITAYMMAVDTLKDHLADYDFGLMIVTDEETGGFKGAVKLIEAGYLPKVMVIEDGTPGWNLDKASKGIWHVVIEAHGKTAHGSCPWAGENAVDKIISCIQDIRSHFPELTAESNTFNVGLIRGGQAINQVPSHATAGIDIRFTNKKEYARIRAGVEAALERHGAAISEEMYGDTMENDVTNPYLATYKACMEEAIGREVNWVLSKAANDGRWFSAKGVPCAVFYPDGSGHHSAEEWVSTEALGQMEAVFVSFLDKVARS